ncbi:hypothetical protein G6F24_017140 [Rhizopus arrhizus]|nr:hypothetical protein G6F24_017140 [Rhizopus arrhizus]
MPSFPWAARCSARWLNGACRWQIKKPSMSTPNTNQLTITRPDDWHLHLRDGAALEAVVADTARQFARAIIMPNLKPPVTTTEQALAYRGRILEALGKAGGNPEASSARTSRARSMP